VVPLKFTPYGDAVREHVDDLRRMVARKVRAADPGAKPPIEFVGLPRLVEAVKNFQAQASAADRATSALAARDGIAPDRLARVNDALTRVERSFLIPDGLPGRAWFKHAIYAPGLTTGYACWPLPGVRQAVLDSDPVMLESQTAALVARLDEASAALKAVATLAEEPKPPQAAGTPARPAPRPATGETTKPEPRPGGPER
jgi:N-acetylated-alpha-linked acidic dipeptidase